MAKKILKAEYGSEETPLKLGDIRIPCYVLEDGRRVLSGKGMQDGLGFDKRSSGTALAKFLSRPKIQEIIPQEVTEKLEQRIEFTRKGSGGAVAKTYGYDATLLVDLCDLFIQAKKQGRLTAGQEILADQAEIIIRSVAKVGLIALIDEVTGYQEVRTKDFLQGLLDKYLRKELAIWAKRFPDEFYKEMFRLRGWTWNPKSVKRPSVVGKYTNDLVYERLAPQILEELEKKNPKNENGNRINRHHQWLTDDIGNPALTQHIHAIMGLMRAAAKWDDFYRWVQRAFPKKNEQLPLLTED